MLSCEGMCVTTRYRFTLRLVTVCCVVSVVVRGCCFRCCSFRADAKGTGEPATKEATFDPFQGVPTSVPPSPEDILADERRELLQPLNKLDCPETFDPDSPANAPLWERLNKLRLQKVCAVCFGRRCLVVCCRSSQELLGSLFTTVGHR